MAEGRVMEAARAEAAVDGRDKRSARCRRVPTHDPERLTNAQLRSVLETKARSLSSEVVELCTNETTREEADRTERGLGEQPVGRGRGERAAVKKSVVRSAWKER